MLDVDAFLEDYERHYNEIEQLDQGAFWTADPSTAIPWMEAFWGCDIIAGENSIVSHPCVRNIKDLDRLGFSMDNPWVEKYFEFVRKLNILSQGRFPVGQPIMRGQADVAGALLGQSELIFALYEAPDIMKGFFRKTAEALVRINEEMHRLNTPFHGGSAMGFYHLWAPGKCIWFQDDLCALLSPDLYREFLLENEKLMCANYDYTLVHLHPSSFYNLDNMLTNERLRVIQINKDVGGPSVEMMLPEFSKVLQTGRNLVIWGDLTVEEIKIVYDNLPPEGIFFNLAEPDYKTAEKVSGYLNSLRLPG
jgi:hypothetical protein